MANTKSILQKVNHEEKAESFFLMKGQIKTPEKQLNELEIGNLPEKEFRIMIVKMIQDLKERMEANVNKIPEMFTKD